MNQEQKEGLERSIDAFEKWMLVQIAAWYKLISEMKKQLNEQEN